jgi:hypothetical protein
MTLNPKIWGPPFWFTLQTISINYPTSPNETTKKKYYDFIQNIPLFIPDDSFGNKFVELLDDFPVTPYLDSRTSFMKWINFIHNQINKKLGKPIIEFQDGINKYYEHYKPPEIKNKKEIKEKQKIIYGTFIVLALLSAFYLYNK